MWKSLAVVAVATPIAAADPIEEPRDPAIATLISLGTTGLGLGAIYGGLQGYGNFELLLLGGAGVIAGPSLGFVYGTRGDVSTPSRGLSIRAAGAGLVFLGAAIDVKDLLEHGPCDLSCPSITTGEYLAAAGLAVAIVGAAIDISEVGAATLRSNARHSTQIRVAPTALHAPGQSTTLGIGLQGTF